MRQLDRRRLTVNGQRVDLARCAVEGFRRVLDMKRAYCPAASSPRWRMREDQSRGVSLCQYAGVRSAWFAIALRRFAICILLCAHRWTAMSQPRFQLRQMFWNILETQAAPRTGFILVKRASSTSAGLAMRSLRQRWLAVEPDCLSRTIPFPIPSHAMWLPGRARH